MVEIAGQADLEGWLANRDSDVGVAIACRSALRVAPLIDSGPGRKDILLPSFHAIAAASLYGELSEAAADETFRAFVAFAADAAAASAAFAADSAAFAADAADSAADSAAFAADSAAFAADAADSAAFAADAADSAATIWKCTAGDCAAIEAGASASELMRSPLWTESVQGPFHDRWNDMVRDLRGRDQQWEVWIDWYEDRLVGLDHPRARPFIPRLERARVKAVHDLIEDDELPDAAIVNARLAELEAKYRGQPPEQLRAIVEVEWRDDGKLHRRPPSEPDTSPDFEGRRQAQIVVMDLLVAADVGRNHPSLAKIVGGYASALGNDTHPLDPIQLQSYGLVLQEFANRADALLLEEAAALLTGAAANHELLMQEIENVEMAADPVVITAEILDSASHVVDQLDQADEWIEPDVRAPLGELRDLSTGLLSQDPDIAPTHQIREQFVRSLSNTLVGFVGAAVNEATSALGRGVSNGLEKFAEKATFIAAAGVSAGFLALAGSNPALFGWLKYALQTIATALAKMAS